jgi:DNA-binding NtrC family response regulator
MNAKRPVLIVEDEIEMLNSYEHMLSKKYTVYRAVDAKEMFECIKKESIDIILLDIMLPGMSGLEAMETIRDYSDAEIIMVTADNTVKTAIRAVKLGAYDYITKPFEIDDLLVAISKALEKTDLAKEVRYLKSELQPQVYEDIISASDKMKQIFSIINEVSNSQSTVLITGESGTGKELVARAIHRSGSNKDKPFVAVDCAAIAENIAESELFGHEKGAFTDATSQKIGKFEMANGGTLFLDEIGNLSEDIQCKILRVLQEREITRVGGTKTIKIDTRVLCATNLDIKKAVKEKKFREDLYYRLNVIPLNLPALSERKADIPLLVEHFIEVFNKELGKKVAGVSREAMECLVNYSWPGNVRELKNIVERLVALSKESIITPKGLPVDILLSESEKTEDYYDKISLRQARDEFEKSFILKMLEKVNWNQSKAAQLLGIHRNALLYKIKLFGLRPEMDKAKLK